MERCRTDYCQREILRGRGGVEIKQLLNTGYIESGANTRFENIYRMSTYCQNIEKGNFTCRISNGGM